MCYYIDELEVYIMEKRLFLAVFLSLGIVFIFQWFVAPTTKVQQNVEQQKIVENELEKNQVMEEFREKLEMLRMNLKVYDNKEE